MTGSFCLGGYVGPTKRVPPRYLGGYEPIFFVRLEPEIPSCYG